MVGIQGVHILQTSGLRRGRQVVASCDGIQPVQPDPRDGCIMNSKKYRLFNAAPSFLVQYVLVVSAVSHAGMLFSFPALPHCQGSS